MVLQELGGKLSAALRKLQSTTVVDEEVVKAIITEITRALLESDVNIKVVMELKKNVEAKINRSEDASGASKKRLIQQAVMEELVAMLDPKTPPYQMKKGASNVIMFVGLQGSGKTTTIAKFAHYYQRKGWRVAMVCADTFRAGAFDQLKQNATKLRVPFYGSYTEADPVRIAEEGVEQFRKDRFEVIIVDTSGRHKQEDALFEEMREIQAAVQPDNCVFVMDATQGQAVADQARAFHEAVPVGSVVITKLDGHAKGGGAMSAVAATKSPITFLGSGEHFDDLEPFVASSFVSKMLGFGDFGSLLRELQDTNDPGMDPKKMMDRMTKGQFTLRDFYQQIQGVLKLGPLNKMMGGMMPGIPDTAQQKRFLYMMDSMRDDELDGKVDIAGNEKRVTRIARGSGTRVEEVQLLLRQHKAREKVVAQMGKSGMMNAATDPAMAAKMAQLMQNPNSRASQAAMSKMMSPQMLKQMGGRDGVAKRMREMGGMPGMAGGGGMDMASMMQAMGGGGAGAGGAGGGMDMQAMMQMAQQMGGGGGGGPGGMDMSSIMQMAQQMGMGGAGGGGGGMPDMAQMAQMMGGEVIGGRYRVERKLERGTFTELYQAVDTRPPKASPDGRRANGDAAKQPPAPTRVALKVEVQGMQQSVLKWESYVLRELQSLPFVARYVGQHTHGDKEVLVMELLHGGDVRALRMRQNCPPGTPMPISACIDLAQEMLRCLEGLHGAGYLHRDVKPSNFVRRNRGDKQLCLVDFGLANKYMKSDGVMRDERPHAEFRGTTTYASPYAHDFKDQSRRDDLFALVYVFLDLARGELPDQSRRDDLFALVYVFLDLARGELPWSAAVRAKNKDEVARLKKEYLNAPFMKTLPYNIAIGTMLRHLKALAWGDAPSYALLRRALEDMRAFAPHADEAPRLDFNWDPPAPPPRASTSTLTSTPAEHKSLAAKLEDVQREGLSELERCKRWSAAASAVPVEQLEQLLEVACKYNEFYITPGLSAKQMYKVQRQVYDVEQAVEAAKSRPPPVMSFTMA